ncbi:MAG: hypothetical protein LBC61_05430, partial [Candidatus Peribacteria bacterium]|nr:hypothetical protein [Candidatus Peribacteria bacterium]
MEKLNFHKMGIHKGQKRIKLKLKRKIIFLNIVLNIKVKWLRILFGPKVARSSAYQYKEVKFQPGAASISNFIYLFNNNSMMDKKTKQQKRQEVIDSLTKEESSEIINILAELLKDKVSKEDIEKLK